MRFVEANPDLVAAELGFFTKKEECMKKEDEEHQRRINAKVDEFFNEIDTERCSDDEEDMKPFTGNDHEAGPLGAIKIESDEDNE